MFVTYSLVLTFYSQLPFQILPKLVEYWHKIFWLSYIFLTCLCDTFFSLRKRHENQKNILYFLDQLLIAEYSCAYHFYWKNQKLQKNISICIANLKCFRDLPEHLHNVKTRLFFTIFTRVLVVLNLLNKIIKKIEKQKTSGIPICICEVSLSILLQKTCFPSQKKFTFDFFVYLKLVDVSHK